MAGTNSEIVYFDCEGRENYEDVLRIAQRRAMQDDISAVIVFSGSDEGAIEAARMFQGDELPPLTVVTYRAESRGYREGEDGEAATFPIGLSADAEVSLGTPAVRAAMPFSNEVVVLRYADPKLSGIREALRLLGGGLVLVVQAVLMACDAGRVREGQRVVAFAADTAIVATAAHSDTVFFPDVGMEISEVLCKPSTFSISRDRGLKIEEPTEELPI